MSLSGLIILEASPAPAKSREEDDAAAGLGVTGTNARAVSGLLPRTSWDMDEARTVPRWCRHDGACIVIPDSYMVG
jgi:hypothetical protein